jgi:hypothetical protein
MWPKSSGCPTATVTVWPARGSADLKGITRAMWLWKNGRMMGSLQGGAQVVTTNITCCMRWSCVLWVLAASALLGHGSCQAGVRSAGVNMTKFNAAVTYRQVPDRTGQQFPAHVTCATKSMQRPAPHSCTAITRRTCRLLLL